MGWEAVKEYLLSTEGSTGGKMADRTKQEAELKKLTEEVAGLRAEVKALRTERDRTAEINGLQRTINELEISKSKLEEENARKIRDTEHNVGLLRKAQELEKAQQDADIAAARREAVLEVKEKNLEAEKKQFDENMKFQREHFEKVAEDQKDLLKEIMKRLPDVTATYTTTTGKKEKVS